jgi:hypothetical protein
LPGIADEFRAFAFLETRGFVRLGRNRSVAADGKAD